MSIQPNTNARGCASGFPQPISDEDEMAALNMVSRVLYVNCIQAGGPTLGQIVYRNSSEEQDILNHVFRFDLRDYTEIFRSGFQARPQENTPDEVYFNLLDHVNNAGAPVNPGVVTTPHAFISTTFCSSLNTRYTNPVGTVIYRYEIYAPGGIFVGPTLGDHYMFAAQKEVAFVGGIAPQYIRAVQLFTITGYNNLGFATLERSDPVNPQIVLNLYFNPQSAPPRLLQIRNPACVFLNRDNRRQTLGIVIYPARTSREASESDASIQWYSEDVQDSESYITAAFRSSRTDEVYMFMGTEYALVNYAPGSKNDRIVNGPLLICDGFPSLAKTPFAEYGIDCAFSTHSGNEAYVFSMNLCALINYAPGTTDDWIIKGPLPIASMFPFFKQTEFENGIDAAFQATATSEAYLFRGDQYALINYSTDKPHSVIPHITDGFGGLRGSIFENGIDAAFASHRHNEAYIFKGRKFASPQPSYEHYALINFAPGSTDDYMIGGVKELLPNWPSLKGILPRKNQGLDVLN